jgi:hypothetical protein
MKNFDHKKESEGLGDTIAKLTHALSLDDLTDLLVKAVGKKDCGCNKRREK